MKMLVTGFTPFGGEQINPSWEAVKRLPDRIGGAELIKRELPTEFDASGTVLHGLLERLRPDAVGKPAYRLPRRVDALAAEGRDARAKDRHRTASSPIIRRMISLSVSRMPSRAMLLTARMVFSTPLTTMPSPP